MGKAAISQTAQLVGHHLSPSTDYSASFDLLPFEFQHQLTGHPLFQMDRILKLARDTTQYRPGDVYFDCGDIAVNDRWNSHPTKLTVVEAMENLESSGAWVLLRQLEGDPEYAALLDDCMAEVHRYVGRDFTNELRIKANSLLFVSSPNRITTFHIDRECSFLAQIQGDKEISVFDRTDREVVREDEVEKFWAVDNNAPRYKEHLQNRAQVYQLRPGNGVHIPVNTPHWLKNGNNISVSYNINCQFKDSVRANLYRANYYLRKFGLEPRPPGTSRVRDGIKKGVMGGILTSKRVLKKVLTRQ